MPVCSGLGLCDEDLLQLEAGERKIGPPVEKKIKEAFGESRHHEANAILLSSLSFSLTVRSHGTILGLKIILFLRFSLAL